ncbi:tetratricopeptide repeat-containing sensor histidine kinase [Fulvivirga ulvae]|uniref:tetratricopeptide repeat-containing sensor histidine kinase n=1 Tax=Fulvivirga ulvae TaxID=2904245 RepID=UPI001F3801E9|nr:tetratricopeptide repeat-containing sensor histidine kinase [Fulvivirga ulvae]UII30078.1 tetratricopeptide repeat-containing sensor histidine kinase [Fulvivirga ulvae]
MRKHLYILFILFACSGLLRAQDQAKIDSLKRAFNESQSDSLKLEILFYLVNEYNYNNVDTAIQLAIQARNLAVELQDSLYLAFADEMLAGYHTVQSNYKEALKYDLEALRLYKQMDYGAGVTLALNSIGEDYYDLDLFSDAYDYYQQSLKKAQEINDKLYIAITTYNIGRVLKSMGQLEKAREYIENSMKLSSVIDDHEGLAYSGHDIGEILIMEGQYEKALTELQKALELSMKLKTTVLIPQILNKIAIAYENLGEFEKSLDYHDRALKRYEELNNKSGIAETQLGLGVARMKMGEYDKAGELLDASLKISKGMNNNELIIKAYEEMSNLYERKGEYKLSLKYYKMFKAMEDSVFSEKQKEQFAQIQIKYETANKDMEIALLNQKEEQQKTQLKNEEFFRNILVVILAFTAVLLITLYRSSVRRKKINDLLVIHQKEMEEQSRELAGLLEMKDKFFSIVSHDVRSPIHALVGILDMLDEGNLNQEELRQLTKSLKVRLDNTRKLLDNLLDWALVQMNEITIQEEPLELKELVEENLNFFREINDKSIQFIDLVEEDMSVLADRNMLDLIIRNLVANSIKFTREGGYVEISAKDKDNDTLIISIKDNGIGMSEEQKSQLFNTTVLYTTKGTANEKGTGLGLKLCKEFVERMGGKIWVESKEGEGSTFKFTIKKEPIF